MSNYTHTDEDDTAVSALLLHVSTSIALLQAVGVPSGGIAKALLTAAISQGRQAIGPNEFANVLRGLADEIDAHEALKVTMPAGSA